MAGVAAAQSYTYNYTISGPSYPITDICTAELFQNGDLGIRWADPSLNTISVAQGGTVSWSDNFDAYNPADGVTTNSLVLGVTHDLPGDAPGQLHMVLGVSNLFGTYTQGIAWGSIFRTTDEDALIAAVQGAATGNFGTDFSNLNAIANFFRGDAMVNLPFPSNVNATFNPDPSGNLSGTSFTLEAWSGGQTIGYGGVTVTAQAVPEPAQFVLLGLGALALMFRRK